MEMSGLLFDATTRHIRIMLAKKVTFTKIWRVSRGCLQVIIILLFNIIILSNLIKKLKYLVGTESH